MKKVLPVLALMLAVSCAPKQASDGVAKEDMRFPMGQQLPAPPFSGEAYIQPLIALDTVFNFPTSNCITFGPGSHSAWHRHGAMTVIGIAGKGLYQEDGKTAQLILPGDVVEIPAGARHFHGAAPGSWFQQIVIYDAAWKPDAHVDEDNTLTDEYYTSLKPVASEKALEHTDGLMFEPALEFIELPTFNGKIRLSNVLDDGNEAGAPGLHYVVFEPGVINAWHSHAGGQVLICTDGIGYHQIEGQPVEVMHPGDVCKCPPGIKHWHGAAPGSRFAHLAANTNPDQPGVEWSNEFVSEEEYNNFPKE
jgi:quercetin dioxygenase-like cupin family protein